MTQIKQSTAVVVRNEPNFRQCANASFPPRHPRIESSKKVAAANRTLSPINRCERSPASITALKRQFGQIDDRLLIGLLAAPSHLPAAAQDSRSSIGQGAVVCAPPDRNGGLKRSRPFFRESNSAAAKYLFDNGDLDQSFPLQPAQIPGEGRFVQARPDRKRAKGIVG